MPYTGVDYAWGRPGGAALAAAGHTFVMRYLSRDRSKNLTAEELADLRAHGLRVGLVWETTANRAGSGYAAGADDARQALAQADALGLTGALIYAAVDYDVQEAGLPAVRDYFRGWNTVLPAWRTGVYGGYRAVQDIVGQGLAVHGWQTTAWSNGHWSEHTDIRQVGGTATIGGVQCDLNTCTDPDAAVSVAPARPMPAPAPAVPAWPGQYLRNPTYNSAVARRWQQQMAARGWSISVDGDYGPKSAAVCRTFQQRFGLTVDGVVGPDTWQAAFS
ncbi:glycoside hydrolase domain-containing protein [Kitasatospora sp. NPDC057198]|uniref:glycoside hydrolase domain-containing protein n=1 Tax=Kitasatospora sp. NPDC057198 TaxID=3346046 RepID=UPI00363A59FB